MFAMRVSFSRLILLTYEWLRKEFQTPPESLSTDLWITPQMIRIGPPADTYEYLRSDFMRTTTGSPARIARKIGQ